MTNRITTLTADDNGRFRSGGTASAPHRSIFSADTRADTQRMRIASPIKKILVTADEK